ncbi:MAG: hypothetical protein ACRDTZ_03370 [Pseudonocardiaceae bacterium]
MPTDPQSRAYREADADSSWDGDLSALPGAVAHEPITDVGHIVGVEEYEAAGWDSARTAPKTLAEAHDTLRTRIDDPRAPDTDAERDAYNKDD